MEETIAAGIPVNVTLIFSVKRYGEVADAYLRGVERLLVGGGDPRGGLRGVLLRLPGRHGGGPALLSTGGAVADSPNAETALSLIGKLAVANAQAATRSSCRSPPRTVEGPRGARRARPAGPVGEHRHEEPDLH